MSARTFSLSWRMCWLASRSLLCVLRIKSPGTVSGALYIIYTEEQSRSSLGAVLIPRSTQGNQFGPVRRARSAVFR